MYLEEKSISFVKVYFFLKIIFSINHCRTILCLGKDIIRKSENQIIR